MRKLKENNIALRQVIKWVIVVLLIAGCGVLFFVFGKRRIMPVSGAAGEVLPTPLPSGIAAGRLTGLLKEGGASCAFSPPNRMDDGTIEYRFVLLDKRNDGILRIATDDIGRVTTLEMSFGYIYAGEPGEQFGPVTREAITNEYRRREREDRELIESTLGTLVSLAAESCNIGAVDAKKLLPAITDAYLARERKEQKAGKARFLCETTSEDGFNFVYHLTAQFDYAN